MGRFSGFDLPSAKKLHVARFDEIRAQHGVKERDSAIEESRLA
jgi:hypothetical protein